MFGSEHPTFFKFLNELKKYLEYQSREIEQLMIGYLPIPSKKKYIYLNELILNTFNSFNKLTIKNYLRSIALNYIF